MSNHNSDDQQRSKPSFAGNMMPFNINPNINDHCVGDEVTRRVGAFQPNFERISSFQPPSMTAFDSHVDVLQRKGTSPGKQMSSPQCGMWRLDRVPSLPDFHPLERTSVFVPNVVHPEDVSVRISDVLRDRSIDAAYDNEKAKAVCTTMEGVEFRVRLYRGRGDYKGGVIVEVQRRFGTSVSFHDDTMAILNVAQGKELPSSASLLRSNGTSNLPLVEDDEESQVDGTKSLAMISKMFNHSEHEAHTLALQMLTSLTDVAKMGRKTARAVSVELFRLVNDNVVGAKILSLIVDTQDEDTIMLRTVALNIAANAFEAVEGQFPLLLKEQLRPVLLMELLCAEENPRNAVHAARIISYYIPQDSGDDLYSALKEARKVGVLRNALLEHHVQECLDKF
jgi:hypothetical protein